MRRRWLWHLNETSLVLYTSPLLAAPPSAKVLSCLQDVQSLQPSVQRLLIDEFHLGESASRLCPALLVDNTVVVFAVQEQCVGDAISTLIEQIKRKGYGLADPVCYVLGLSVLLELIRDPSLAGGEGHLSQAGQKTPWTQADLFNAFLDIVRWGVEHQASDIHINVFIEKEISEVRFSIAGRYIKPAKFQSLTTQFLLDVLSVAWMSIKGGNGAVFDPHKEQQGSLSCQIDGQSVMLRWGALAAEFGPSVCLRLLPRSNALVLPTLAQLGYLPDQQVILEQALLSDTGAVVFSGAVGSGKSTTLAAMVAALPTWRKVISLEDPVEYLIPNAVQVSLSRDLHQDSHTTFAAKLRALKRSAMSDVLLGEIRDVETGRAFTDLSSSGVRLYTTVHAASAALVPARLHSDFIGVSMDLLSAPNVLRLLVHQCLLPKLCLHCAYSLTELSDYPNYLPLHLYANLPYQRWRQRLISLIGESGFNTAKVRNIAGCEQCKHQGLAELLGWDGRVVCAEVLEPALFTDYLAALRKNQDVIAALQKNQWQDVRYSALRQIQRGVVDPFDVEAHFALFMTARWQSILDGATHG